MAGVGIFFQQEPMTGKVYVANIVPGGSADRSGVIRVNDVIVKVDDEDVQGQPLATLRNLILGKQVTIEFSVLLNKYLHRWAGILCCPGLPKNDRDRALLLRC